MVRQAYVNRLVLGRSAFDPSNELTRDNADAQSGADTEGAQETSTVVPRDEYHQHYNTRGYPENRDSRQLARRNRHAQNDILTTIGVCVSVDEEGQAQSNLPPGPKTAAEREQARVIIEEHWYGSMIGSISEMSAESASLWILFLSKRIQVFEAYLAVPLPTIICTEWQQTNLLTFFAPGFFPDMIFHALKGLTEGVFETLVEPLAPYWMQKFCDFFSIDAERTILVGGILWRTGVRCARISMGVLMDMFISLQQLRLIDSWPLFSMNTFVTILTLRPSKPSHWTLSSTMAYAQAVLASPFILAFTYSIVESTMRERLFYYVQTQLTRPDNPDTGSFRLELDDEKVDTSEAPVLRLPGSQRTFAEQLAADYRLVRFWIAGARLSLRKSVDGWFDPRPRAPRPRVVEVPQTVSFAPDDETVERSASPEPEGSSADPQQLSTTPETSASPPRSPSSSTMDAVSEIDPSAVQVRTRSGSTSTLHMDLEVQLPLPTQQMRERRRNSFTQTEGESSESAPEKEATKDHHRVTLLTVHSSTTLSVQLSIILASAILLPLEGLYLRTLARSFLNARGLSSSQVGSAIYRPYGLGLQRYGWKGVFAYGTQMLLCLGLETGIRLYFWRICGTASLWWGRTKFSWGQL